jgi:hypothetical protein
MEYLLLVYEKQNTSLPDDPLLEEACKENNHALQESGYLLWGANLQLDGSARLSLRDEVVVAPQSTTLSGVYLIRAKDMNEAIRTARTMPQARLGTIEIQTVVSLEGTTT